MENDNSLWIEQIRRTGAGSDGRTKYEAVFKIKHGTIATELAVIAETDQGWENARLLACEKVREFGAWLQAAIEHERSTYSS